jgi:hypothetical protein
MSFLLMLLVSLLGTLWVFGVIWLERNQPAEKDKDALLYPRPPRG